MTANLANKSLYFDIKTHERTLFVTHFRSESMFASIGNTIGDKNKHLYLEMSAFCYGVEINPDGSERVKYHSNHA